MLCDENRMPFPRRLLAVVLRLGRRESLCNEVVRVCDNGRQPFLLQIRFVFRAESKPLSKR